MTKRQPKRRSGRRERHVSVRGVRRDPPDLRKLARALAALAIAQVEADAQSEDEARSFEKRLDGTADSDQKAAS